MPRSGRFTPGKENLYPLHKGLDGQQGYYEYVRKTSPPPGFDPQTIYPLASRYTDYAFPTRKHQYEFFYFPSPSGIAINIPMTLSWLPY
jgi:hypothetical protein